MGVSQVCVCRHNTVTFSSGSDGRVFLCPLEDVKRKMCEVRREMFGCCAVEMRG